MDPATQRRTEAARLPARGDVVLAVVLSVAGAVQALATAGTHSLAVAALVAVGLASLAFRRSHPLATFMSMSAVMVVAGQLPDSGVQVALPIGVLIACFSLGHEDPRERSVVAIGVLLAAMAIMMLRVDSPISDVVFTQVIYGGAFGLGRLAGARRAQANQALGAHAMLKQRQDLLRDEALQAERTRVARELHDIVAHSVSIVVVQAQAVRTRLAAGAHAEALHGLDAIEAAGREGMQEMRRLLGVLRADGADAPLAPQPGVDQAQGLVQAARSAGASVELRVTGEPRDLSPGISVTVFRALQEALTNCRRHAPHDPVEVELRWSVRELSLIVVNGCSSSPGSGTGHGDCGLGLVGMSERANLFGGDLLAGRVEERGASRFRLELRLPIGPVPTLQTAVGGTG